MLPEPCVAVKPGLANFGGVHVGFSSEWSLEITACGELPLKVYDVYLLSGSSPDFTLDLEHLGPVPSAEKPLVIPAGGIAHFSALYVPDEVNPVDEGGETILDEGTVVVATNSPAGDSHVELVGQGGTGGACCVTPIIKCDEGDEVTPQTVLHLYGDQSYSTWGEVVEWEWEVEQPVGSQSVFIPSNTVAQPTFEVNVAGVYTFRLWATDDWGEPSYGPAHYEVVVIPDAAIHIELLWHTPEDPDETDTGPDAGSDLDLHVIHPLAGGPDLDGDGAPDGWYDIPFDCFWFNAHPNWGDPDPAVFDDPHLDRDDTDGAGPENLNMYSPEELTYRIGVHYWNDHGFGPAYATVRVYIYAQHVFEVMDLMLVESDMWEVATMDWPSGEVHAVLDGLGLPKITPSYNNPFFFQ